jgi:hypothetical protein
MQKHRLLFLNTIFLSLWMNLFPVQNLLLGQSMTPENGNLPSPQPEAMWDLEWEWDLQSLLGISSVRGVTWFNQTFWITDSQSDSLYLLDNNGTFLQTVAVPSAGPNTGYTSLTHDGNHLFGVNLGDYISEIDPNTFNLVDSVPITPGTNALYVEYDPNLDSGNGGFHVGGIGGGSIFQYSRNGILLGEITAATHGLNNIVGLAHDNFSPGGPYLWAFSQEGVPSNAVISQLQLPQGNYTGTQHDASLNLTGSNQLAGGLCIVPSFPPLNHALLTGVIQNPGDRLFAYELNFQFLGVDVALDRFYPVPAFTQLPLSQLSPLDFYTEAFNVGADTAWQGELQLSIEDENQSLVYADTQSWAQLAPAQIQGLNFGPWTPAGKGHYFGQTILATNSQVDVNAANDSSFLSLYVNDSVFARDDGTIQEALGIGPDSNDQAILGQNFQIQNTDFCTSVTMVLVHPPAGERVSASIYEVNANGKPLNLLGQTREYLITAEDAGDTLWLTLPFPTAPLGLPPGEFFVGVNESGKKVQLAASARYWLPGTTWINWVNNPQGGWANMEDFAFKISFLLRPNFGPCSPTYLQAQLQILQNDSGQGDAALAVQASGGVPPYSYLWDDPLAQTTAQINGQTGGRTYACTISDQNGCRTTLRSDTVSIGSSLLESSKIRSFALFPNPTKEKVHFRMELAEASSLEIRLWELNGKLMQEWSLPPHTVHRQTISVQEEGPGIYLLEIMADGEVYHRLLSKI